MDAVLIADQRLHGTGAFTQSSFMVGQIFGNFIFGENELPQFLVENSFEVINRNFVAAPCTAIFWTVGWHIHFRVAVAEGQAGKEMDYLLGNWLLVGFAVSHDGRALIP
jgi:hypothetical protein